MNKETTKRLKAMYKELLEDTISLTNEIEIDNMIKSGQLDKKDVCDYWKNKEKYTFIGEKWTKMYFDEAFNLDNDNITKINFSQGTKKSVFTLFDFSKTAKKIVKMAKKLKCVLFLILLLKRK